MVKIMHLDCSHNLCAGLYEGQILRMWRLIVFDDAAWKAIQHDHRADFQPHIILMRGRTEEDMYNKESRPGLLLRVGNRRLEDI